MSQVYFIASLDLGVVKIGFAENAKTRFNKIQSDSPAPVVLLAIEQGTREREAELHARFSHLRHRGEWFRLEGTLAEYIGALTPYITPPRRQPKTSHQKVIVAFGGVRPMARKLGHRSPTTVKYWWDNCIPYKNWGAVECAAREHGIPFSMTDLLPAEAA